MATETIRGLTVKIGADTNDFLKALKKVDYSVTRTQRQLNALREGLNLEYDPKRFVAAQKTLQDALKTTELEAAAARKELKYLEENGAVNTKGYEDVQTQLALTETKVISLKKQLKDLDNIKLENATKGLKNFGDKATAAGKALAAVSVAAGAAIAGAIKLAKTAAETGYEINSTAERFGISAEAVQKWNYVAIQSDISNAVLLKGLKKLNVAFGDQWQGTVNIATEALKSIGVDIRRFSGDTDAALLATINAIKGLGSTVEQTSVITKIFGEEVGSQITPLFDQSSEAIAQYIKEFEQIGYLTNEQISTLTEWQKEWKKITQEFDNAKAKIGLALIPVMKTLGYLLENVIVPDLEKLSNRFASLGQVGQTIVLVILSLVAAAAPLLIVVGKVATGIAALIPLIAKLHLTISKTTLGFVALGAAISAALIFGLQYDQLSVVEKFLYGIATAALAAGAAMLAFHASWSVGLAVGGIVAALAGAFAIYKEMTKGIPGVGSKLSNIGVSGSSGSSYDVPTAIPDTGSTSYGGDVVTDNSTININVSLNSSGKLDYDARELANAINQELLNRKLAYR